MNKEQHQNEITSTRIGGLGGSDAAMVYAIGKRGYLLKTDRKRLAVMLGIIPPKEERITTRAMKAGHDFEDYLDWERKDFIPCEREFKIEKKSTLSFKIFAHADFYNIENQIVYECKYSQKETDKVINTYKAQLQWYYLLGVKSVILVHGQGDVYELEVNNRIKAIHDVEIPNDYSIQEILLEGLKIINKEIKDFKYEKESIFKFADVDVWTAAEIIELAKKTKQLDQLKGEIEILRKKMTDYFDANSIDRFEDEDFSITFREGAIIPKLDTDLLFKLNPSIKRVDYCKEVAHESGIIVKIKK